MATSVKNVAKYGWFAARLRRLMKERHLRSVDLARQIVEITKGNLTAAQTNISTWARALGLPGPSYRKPLARVLGVPEAELYARNTNTDAPSPGPAPRQDLALYEAAMPVPQGAANGAGVFEPSFTVAVAHGVADVRLHTQLPLAELERLILGLRQLGVIP
jgi:hypothetical protein